MSTPRSRLAELIVVSFVTLFLELSLIRWISTEIRIFSYVNNLVLLACFLGIGLGCYLTRRRPSLTQSLVGLLALMLLVRAPLELPVGNQRLHLIRDTPTLLSAFDDTFIWYEIATGGLWLRLILGMVSTLLVFSIIVVIFMPLGQILARCLQEHRDLIAAYSINVGASLLGIWCMNLFALLYQPPWVWFLLSLAGLAFLARERAPATPVAVVALILCLGSVALDAARPWLRDEAVLWSPYQKLEIQPLDPPEMGRGYNLLVNGVGFMSLIDLSNEFIARWPGILDARRRDYSHYDIPYLLKPDPQQVLIVGAGGGNDVAGALRHGPGQVTAVEIDPGVYRLGDALHPESPYSDPRVEVVIDDARSFFKKTTRRYDLVVFGLLDSHTSASTMNNTRIDNYVYTLESIQEAKELLAEGGVLSVTFEARRDWIADRLFGMLTAAFGHEPVAFWVRSEGHLYGPGGLMMITSRDIATLHALIEEQPRLAAIIDTNRHEPSTEVEGTTDDWPYLYLRSASIPTLHLCLTGALLLFLVPGKRLLFGRGRRLNWHFFFLGAAFLLLEFLNISKSALLFGSTWVVSSFTLTGILVWILLANLVVHRWPNLSMRLAYGLLFMTIVAVTFLPLSLLSTLPIVPRALTAGILLNTPIFFAGMIFIRSFARAPEPSTAFGSNLLGAAVGGLLESISFLAGIQFMMSVVGLLYLASLLSVLRGRGASR